MALLELLLLTVGALWLSYVLLKAWRKRHVKLPPGPRGLPLLGNILDLRENGHLKFFQWAEQYGEFLTIHVGQTPIVVVNDVKWMKHLFNHEVSTGVYQTVFWDLYQGPFGLVNADGEWWEEKRNLFFKITKRFGFGKGSLIEPLIMSEISGFCEWLDTEMRSKGGVLVNDRLNHVTANILWSTVTGERIESKVVKFINDYIEHIQEATKWGLYFFPWVRHLWPGYGGYVRACESLHSFVEKHFVARQQTRRERDGDSRDDIMSAYLDHVEGTKDKKSCFYGDIGFKNSVGSVLNLLAAGTDTTAITMHWLIVYLTVYPDVQERVRREIEEQIEKDRDPSLGDRARMPYCEAVIQETLRHSSIVPLGVVHQLKDNLSLAQYHFPKGLLVMANTYRVHYDSRVWGDPETFRPERFLSEKGTSDVIPGGSVYRGGNLRDYVVPFQPGKRTCVGEGIVRDLLFLFLTKIVKSITFSLGEGRKKEEYLVPKTGFLLTPKDLPIVTQMIKL